MFIFLQILYKDGGAATNMSTMSTTNLTEGTTKATITDTTTGGSVSTNNTILVPVYNQTNPQEFGCIKKMIDLRVDITPKAIKEPISYKS